MGGDSPIVLTVTHLFFLNKLLTCNRGDGHHKHSVLSFLIICYGALCGLMELFYNNNQFPTLQGWHF
jgi:hypothetical protein